MNNVASGRRRLARKSVMRESKAMCRACSVMFYSKPGGHDRFKKHDVVGQRIVRVHGTPVMHLLERWLFRAVSSLVSSLTHASPN